MIGFIHWVPFAFRRVCLVQIVGPIAVVAVHDPRAAQELDFLALEHAAAYAGGYTAASRVVREFWGAAHDFDEVWQQHAVSHTLAAILAVLAARRGL